MVTIESNTLNQAQIFMFANGRHENYFLSEVNDDFFEETGTRKVYIDSYAYSEFKEAHEGYNSNKFEEEIEYLAKIGNGDVYELEMELEGCQRAAIIEDHLIQYLRPVICTLQLTRNFRVSIPSPFIAFVQDNIFFMSSHESSARKCDMKVKTNLATLMEFYKVLRKVKLYGDGWLTQSCDIGPSDKPRIISALSKSMTLMKDDADLQRKMQQQPATADPALVTTLQQASTTTPQQVGNAAAFPQYVIPGPTKADTKYQQLVFLINEIGKDLPQMYNGSKHCSEKVKRYLVHARILARECMMEADRERAKMTTGSS
ncbi:unnamed protein product, partial [Mesorhabditis spiculigera]